MCSGVARSDNDFTLTSAMFNKFREQNALFDYILQSKIIQKHHSLYRMRFQTLQKGKIVCNTDFVAQNIILQHKTLRCKVFPIIAIKVMLHLQDIAEPLNFTGQVIELIQTFCGKLNVSVQIT